MYELLTGLTPYSGMSHATIAHGVTDQKLRPGDLGTKIGVPPVLAELLRAMWSHHAAARPSAQAVLNTLNKYAQSQANVCGRGGSVRAVSLTVPMPAAALWAGNKPSRRKKPAVEVKAISSPEAAAAACIDH